MNYVVILNTQIVYHMRNHKVISLFDVFSFIIANDAIFQLYALRKGTKQKKSASSALPYLRSPRKQISEVEK